GTQDLDGIKVTMTNAFHSSSMPDGRYAGEPAGLVVELEDGLKLYFAGDTCVFGDMQLIARLYAPDVAVLPIGDHYTMGPRQAGRIVARGRNRIFDGGGSRLRHAEVNALLELDGARTYEDHVLLTSLEPCHLCVGACHAARIGTVRFAAADPYGGAVGKLLPV